MREVERKQNLFLLNTSRTELPILWAKAGMCGVTDKGSPGQRANDCFIELQQQ